MSNEADVSRGTRAKTLYESEPFRDAMNSVRAAIIDKWANSPIADIDGQHELRLMLKIHGDFEQNLISVINSGKMAEHTILAEAKVKEAKKKGKFW